MNPDRLAELEEERRFLLHSIGDLDREHAVGDVGDDDYTTLRDGYIARAASVMRTIDDDRAAKPPRLRRPGVVAGWVIGTVAVATLAGWAVAHYSGQRTDAGGALSAANQSSDELTKARIAESQGDSSTALTHYQKAIELDPQSVEARTYIAWLIIRNGNQTDRPAQVAVGIDLLRGAISLDAGYADAHCLLGVSLAKFATPPDPVAARPELETCMSNNPPAIVKQLVTPVLQSIDAVTPPAVATP
ncbi:MAG: tetratricopeptide repeat protein [Ilumatobacteraceae bacterium]